MTAYITELSPEQAPWRWALSFDYSVAMVEAIKVHVPSRQRKWVPDTRQWWFKAEAQATMLHLAGRFCGDVVHVQADGHLTSELPAELVAAYRTLHLLPSAPDELVKHAYRVMCKLHHPDKGGTTATMQRVNEAYGKLASHKASCSQPKASRCTCCNVKKRVSSGVRDTKKATNGNKRQREQPIDINATAGHCGTVE